MLEPPILSANRTKRRLAGRRARVATPLSDRASLVPIGEEQGVDGCHYLRCSLGQRIRSLCAFGVVLGGVGGGASSA